MLTLFYDNLCPICLRSKAFLERIDWWKQLQFIGIRNDKVYTTYPDLDKEAALKRMASRNETSVVYGFETTFRIVKTLPLLWILVPAFYVLRWTGLGVKAYDEVALNRRILPASCDETCAIIE